MPDGFVAHSPPVLTVLAEGDGFIAVSKPPGRIVVPGRSAAAAEVTVRQDLERQLGRALLVVHRLDRDTSGVLLFATDADAHRALSGAFARHEVVKHYWALVKGRLMGVGEIDLHLIPVRGGRVRAARPGESGGKPSRTWWRAQERIGDYTIVDFRPATGRLHQIRVHAAAVGHPLAVDPSYGGNETLTIANVRILGRVPLHARSIKFPHPSTGRAVVVEAPLTQDLLSAVELLRQLSEPIVP